MTRTPPNAPKTKPKAESPDDGGILYEDIETDEDEATDVEDATADVANVAGIEWNESPAATPGLKGAEVIQAFVRHLPNQPGVYRMINEAGDVLYVGKARSR
jgi:excinuclease ABC subunit C